MFKSGFLFIIRPFLSNLSIMQIAQKRLFYFYVMNKTELKTTLAEYLIESRQTLTEEELTDHADSLVSFFELLIETDKKLIRANESSNNRDPNPAD